MHILYDGDCSFCIKIIEKISKLINKKEFYCYAFKSKKGEEIIINYKLKKFNSVIFINKKNQILYKGSAVLHICKHMKKPYNLLYVFNFLPDYIINSLYDFIAKRRHCVVKRN